MPNIIKKIFGSSNERELKKLEPFVELINTEFEKLKNLTDSELQHKTEEFRERLKSGETIDDIMVEAFAVVKEACRRLVGKEWEITGHIWKWEMVPFDCQLMGAVVLHQGKIAEMATGEGKTLAATMPLYLNALEGKSCHLITVNDYLAKRDREWMGEIYNFLGITVGCIQGGMLPEERKKEYECDITYGTNNEFGFDYLRDNMTWRAEDKVQRGHHYAIVDEVDSVLIDEARTPLIISGPVERTVNREYERLKPNVDRVAHKQNLMVNKLIAEGEQLFKNDKEKEAGIKFLMAQRGLPKNKRLMKFKKEQGITKLIEQTEGEYMKDKKLPELDEQLYYTIDEKGHTVNISDIGRDTIAPDNPDFFTLPDLSIELKEIEDNESFSPREKFVKKQELERKYAECSERSHAINQLLRAYSLFEKDVEYIIQDGKVIIVDEFTGRLMPGRRYSDGMHQAIEAKEGVAVEEETQTLATITLQNYFRMYEKLAGMTGTAETEAHEFWDIYKLEVVVLPTNKPVDRTEFPDTIYKTKREKYNAIMKEIEEMHKNGRPTLVGTISVDVSETLARVLKRKGIPHQVLNARYHQKEAEIVAYAGEPGKVTIATNMAGRGTDIKLGSGVADNGGLHIVGTERHEARRTDRQLRGRCARQGDPGSAKFYLSLEDDLMRLFGSDRIAGIMDRFGAKDNEPIEHNLVTRAIATAQKRVERYNFDIRKHLLEYDDVMNKQREAIYKIREEILQGKDISERIWESIDNTIDEIIDAHTDEKEYSENWDWEGLLAEIREVFLIDFKISTEQKHSMKIDDLREEIIKAVEIFYKNREEKFGIEIIRDMERQVMLQVMDRNWREHLYELDALKEGIGLRGYGQRDPLIEYKRESFEMFEQLLVSMDREVSRHLFGLRITRQGEERGAPVKAYKPEAESAKESVTAQATAQEPPPPGIAPGEMPALPQTGERIIETYKRGVEKVGRNDPCPCGSGKKFKKCCRGKGVYD